MDMSILTCQLHVLIRIHLRPWRFLRCLGEHWNRVVEYTRVRYWQQKQYSTTAMGGCPIGAYVWCTSGLRTMRCSSVKFTAHTIQRLMIMIRNAYYLAIV